MSLDSRFPWSFSGFIIGIIALIVSLIIFYYSEQKEEFDFKIIIEDEFNLVELREEIAGLQVLYKEEDIIKQNKVIKVVIYSFVNDGKMIIQDYYDNRIKFGLLFSNSIVFTTKILSSNSEYLEKDFLSQERDTSNRSIVLYNKLIFDSGKKITLKSYLIQNKEIENTKIDVLGKIAGMERIPVQRKKAEIEEEQSKSEDVPTFIKWFLIVYAGLVLVLLIVTVITTIIARILFAKKWNVFSDLFPHYNDYKKLLMKIYTTPRLSNLVRRLIELDNSKGLDESKSYRRIPFPFGSIRVMKPLPTEIFDITSGRIFIKEEKYSAIKLFFKSDEELN
jgi:hypothetical protein